MGNGEWVMGNGNGTDRRAGNRHRVRRSGSRLPAPAQQFPFPITHHPFPRAAQRPRYCATGFTVGYLIPSCSRYVLYFVES